MTKPPAIMQLAGQDDREGAPTEDEKKEPAPPRVVDFDLDAKPHGIDAAAQIGLLKSFCYRQPSPERLHLLAKYAVGEERRAAQRALRDYLMPLINNIIRPRFVVYSCVSRYYGRSVSFKDLALKVEYLVPTTFTNEKARRQEAWRMVRDLSRDVESLLKDLATRTEELAHGELKARGVVA